jgi:hypothetical protein
MVTHVSHPNCPARNKHAIFFALHCNVTAALANGGRYSKLGTLGVRWHPLETAHRITKESTGGPVAYKRQEGLVRVEILPDEKRYTRLVRLFVAACALRLVQPTADARPVQEQVHDRKAAKRDHDPWIPECAPEAIQGFRWCHPLGRTDRKQSNVHPRQPEIRRLRMFFQ